MLAPDWTWWTALPVVLVAIAVLWVPGGLLAKGLGAGWWPSLAVAPTLTASLVGAGGIICGVAGVRWDLVPLLAFCLGVPLLVWLVHRFVVSRLLVRSSAAGPLIVPVPSWQVVVGLLVSASVATVVHVGATGRPGDIPQQPDVIYHLGLVRYFLDTGSISSLTADGFNHPATPSFYPAAFHGVAASVVMLTHAPIVVVESALLLVAAAVVFPLGIMFLMGACFGTQKFEVLMGGVMSAAFTSFPFKLLVYGGLWGLMFGSAFIPAVLALFGLAVRRIFSGGVWAPPAVLFLVAVPGIGLGHTSAAFAVAVGGLLLALAEGIRFGRTATGPPLRRWLPALGIVVVGVLVVSSAAALAPAGLAASATPLVRLRPGIIDALSWWSRREAAYRFGGRALMVLVLLGVGVALRRAGQWWVAVTWLAFMALAFATTVLPPRLIWWFGWPWYNVPTRVQAVAAIYAVPLVGLLGGQLLSLALRAPRALAVVGAGLVGALTAGLLVLQTSAHIAMVRPFYRIYDARAWVLADEVDALRRFSAEMPDDAVVAANPWKGGTYLYLLGPENTLVRTEKSTGADITVIAQGLENVRQDRAVCDAVQQNRVTYVITGGHPQTAAGNRSQLFSGIDDISAAGGFEIVDRVGTYTLWRVPAC